MFALYHFRIIIQLFMKYFTVTHNIRDATIAAAAATTTNTTKQSFN